MPSRRETILATIAAVLRAHDTISDDDVGRLRVDAQIEREQHISVTAGKADLGRMTYTQYIVTMDVLLHLTVTDREHPEQVDTALNALIFTVIKQVAQSEQIKAIDGVQNVFPITMSEATTSLATSPRGTITLTLPILYEEVLTP